MDFSGLTARYSLGENETEVKKQNIPRENQDPKILDFSGDVLI